ncbi:hypothetical protein OG302_29405 [Streptomyces sp. NBC_01283]|uniref:hypothetical protein n=1 Tax=Streptomyces sp. NBC_01283 TaxID=2903812 RepID=UPI00352D37F4|nr:hypothetical protein OG302_29405 [Streptomyces sp. NBC_01283]
MPEPADPDPPDSPEEPEAEALPTLARTLAGIVGVPLTSAGAVAVFTTDNQAGSVALVLVGALFLVMLVSGNPLQSLGHGDTQLRFALATRRKQELERIKETPPEAAIERLAALRAVDPGASKDPWFIQLSAQVYERLIERRITDALPSGGSAQFASLDEGFDLRLSIPRGDHVSVTIKFRPATSLVSVREIQRFIGMTSAIGKAIMVANVRLSQPAANALLQARENGIRAQFVCWRDQQDDSELRSVVQQMTSG